MSTPKSFKKTEINRRIRVAKKSSATLAIGKIEKNTDTFILTYGQFSLIDALMAILDQTGPADVVISTWTAAHAHLDKSAELMASASILSLKMIVDLSFKIRQPSYFNRMIELFGADSIRAIKTHAKFMTIKNNNWNIVVRTSMNLNNNPRLENIEISENKKFVEFFDQITDDIFSELKPNEVNNIQPVLENLKETVNFKKIEAGYIKRGNLNEAKYRTVINKRTRSEITKPSQRKLPGWDN